MLSNKVNYKDNEELSYFDRVSYLDIIIEVWGTKTVDCKNSKAYKIVVFKRLSNPISK